MRLSSEKITRLLWALALVSLPLTSFPWLPLGAAVSPLSIAFALPVLLLCLFDRRRRALLAGSPFYALALFALVAVASTLLNLALGSAPAEPGPYDAGVAARLGSALSDTAALFMGVTFYASAVMMTSSRKEFAFALRWIMTGLGINVAVAIAQGVVLALAPEAEEFIHTLTSVVAIDNGARAGRAYGLTLEPSWLASQLTLLAIPIILMRSLDTSWTRSWLIRGRLRSLRVNPTWFAFAFFFAAIVLSFSRVGLVVSVTSLLIVAALRLVALRSATDFLISFVVLPAVVVVIAVGALSNSYVRAAATSVGEIVANPTEPEALVHAVGSAGVGGRVASWVTGFGTFLESPVTGVGIGQPPFYFYGNIPGWSIDAPVMQEYLTASGEGLPNAKNMPVRVLSETGLVGGVAFAVFVVSHFVYALRTRRLAVTAFALVIAAAVAVNFMQTDSFALPALWWALALLWALARLTRAEEADGDQRAGPPVPARERAEGIPV